MKRTFTKILVAMLLSAASACNYLDMIPDNVATLDHAFNERTQARKFLFTCYSFMPKTGSPSGDPAMLGGDELWWAVARADRMWGIARGEQSVINPIGSQLERLYQGIRNCNIFLENIDRVPDMTEVEKRQWAAEIKFLKAYYHFYLVRMYGPIPLIRENLPISADPETVQVSRESIEDCFDYIITLIDEAIKDLPLTVEDPTQDAGRVDKIAAISIKAKITVYAASPLFNGNSDQAGLANPDGTPLFNTEYSEEKWARAAAACKQAIDLCHSAGKSLYEFGSTYLQYALTDTISTQLSLRNVLSPSVRGWNEEMLWANTNSMASRNFQLLIFPAMETLTGTTSLRGELSPPLKIAEMFYTHHGVPITEDKTWDYLNRYALRTAGSDDRLYIREGYTTASLHFDREPRFYASIGFDGGIWYGHGNYDDRAPGSLFNIEARGGQRNSISSQASTITGYFLKKLNHFENVARLNNSVSIHEYPWPLIRLADLYLLYAESLNESEGPQADVYLYLNKVRTRAGLPTVESAWTTFSTQPEKYTTKAGLREIIRHERLNELAFEGQRFWDLRRWKEATNELNQTIRGWDGFQADPADYYRPVVLFNQTFSTKDYFWPFDENTIIKNKNLVQNLGW